MKRFLLNNKYEKRITSGFMVAMFVLSCAVFLGVLLYSRLLVAYLTLEMENYTRAWLMETSKRGAAMVTAEELNMYRTSEDMALPSYQALRHKLVDYAKEANVLYVYYLRSIEGDKFQYIVDNDFDESTRVGLDSPLVDITEAPGLSIALSGDVSCAELGLYNRFWDGLLSAYAPVFDAEGQVNAICAVDVNDEMLVRSKQREKLLGFLQIAAAMLVLASGILSFTSYKREARYAREAKEAIVAGIEYASKIQRNLLPLDNAFKRAFEDHFVIWKPKDIVGGDIYWIKNFDKGTVLCVCDCTGHGTPGALLTMLVVSTFEATVNESNYKDPAEIIWELEKRLVSMLNLGPEEQKDIEREVNLNDGCDLAVLYIAKDGRVSFSSGNIHVFVCDGNNVTRHKGQRIRIGDGTLNRKEDIKIVTIPANSNNKFYIASDGLYEQIGGDERIPFGYDTFSRVILENHNENQKNITQKVWQAFEDHRGNNVRRDDFELVTFKPRV
jgi:serine phosphatase RsbU (regulator of sigma subunit)